MNPSIYLDPAAVSWRHQQLLEEAKAERMACLVRPASRPVHLRLRGWMAQALLALATWLSPEVGRATPTFELARARRNGFH